MADNYQVLDATGATITISAKEIAAGIFSANVGLRDYPPGQAPMAASLPVAIASNQGAVPISIGAMIADNAGFTPGTSLLLGAGLVFSDVADTALTENDLSFGRINPNNAQVFVGEDDATRGRRWTVKAASTPAVASDTSLVVDLNPGHTWTGATNLGKAEDTAHASGDVGTMALAVRADTAVGLTDAAGDYHPLTVDSAGRLWTNTTLLAGGSALGYGNGASSSQVLRVTMANDSTGVLATVSTVTTVSTLTNITNWGNIVDNAAFTDGTTRLLPAGYIFDDVAGTALTENDAAAARIDSKRAQVIVGEDGTTRAQKWAINSGGALEVHGDVAHDSPASGNPILNGGYASAAAPADVSANGDAVRAWYLRNGAQATVLTAAGALIGGDATNGLDVDVTRLPALVAGSATIGSVGIAAVSTGGATIGKVLSAASTNATNLKASAGKIFGFALLNTNAAVRYLHLYNKASAPTVGTDVPVATFALPGNAAGAGVVVPTEVGAAFATGISYSLTTGAADTDNTAVALNEITGWILYA